MFPNPRKTQSVRQLGTIDIAPLREAVLAIPEAQWDAENAAKPNRFETLSSTRHIVFRFVSNFVDSADAAGLDTACVHNVHRPGFFLTPAGPEPAPLNLASATQGDGQ